MKKTVTAAALIAALTFAGIQTVSANNNRYDSDDNYGPGYCGNYFNRGSNFTKEDQEALEKFNAETATTRREIVVKRSELNALLSKDNPDETKVGKLTGELYDLETDLDNKAEAAGIDNRYAYGPGPGMMHGYGWGPGMMQGYGRGYGRHMMDW
jgi:Spy/CpxP family protein refolding chaperone